MENEYRIRLLSGVGIPVVCGMGSALIYYYFESLKQYYLHVAIVLVGFFFQLVLVSNVNINSDSDKMMFKRGAAGCFAIFAAISYLVLGAINGK